MGSWRNINISEINFVCKSKYSKIDFLNLSFNSQIEFILQILKYYGFSTCIINDIKVMYDLINVKSPISNKKIEECIEDLNLNKNNQEYNIKEIKTNLYEDILIYGYKNRFINDTLSYRESVLNIKEIND